MMKANTFTAGVVAAAMLAVVSMSADAGHGNAGSPWWKMSNPVECTWSEAMMGAC